MEQEVKDFFLSPAPSTRSVYTTFDKGLRENRKANIIRRIVYNRIKMLSKMDTLSMGKRACIYDDNFRAQILFSC
ncbi:hypothetical protein [Treponema vincentii]|uniref:hypothetical protein n=1 Tax=Treponema vincentii TaxID=69710 RepID=UPI003D8BF929